MPTVRIWDKEGIPIKIDTEVKGRGKGSQTVDLVTSVVCFAERKAESVAFMKAAKYVFSFYFPQLGTAENYHHLGVQVRGCEP